VPRVLSPPSLTSGRKCPPYRFKNQPDCHSALLVPRVLFFFLRISSSPRLTPKVPVSGWSGATKSARPYPQSQPYDLTVPPNSENLPLFGNFLGSRLLPFPRRCFVLSSSLMIDACRTRFCAPIEGVADGSEGVWWIGFPPFLFMLPKPFFLFSVWDYECYVWNGMKRREYSFLRIIFLPLSRTSFPYRVVLPHGLRPPPISNLTYILYGVDTSTVQRGELPSFPILPSPRDFSGAVERVLLRCTIPNPGTTRISRQGPSLYSPRSAFASSRSQGRHTFAGASPRPRPFACFFCRRLVVEVFV